MILYIEGRDNFERWSAHSKQLSDMFTLILEFEHDFLKLGTSVVHEFRMVVLDNMCMTDQLTIAENPIVYKFDTPFYYKLTV